MNILLIKNRLPYPIRSGQDLVDYSLIKALSQKHEITLIAPSDHPEHTHEALPELKKFCSEVRVAAIPRRHTFSAKLNWRLKRETDFWVRTIPLAVSDLSFESLRQTISKAAARHPFDFAEITYWTLGQYFKEIKPKVPTILLQHDSYYLYLLRQKLNPPAQKMSLRLRDWYTENSGMLQYEKRVSRDFDWVSYISLADMEGVRGPFGISDRSSVLPIPYHIKAEAVGGINAPAANILFLGGMHTPYNIDSVRQFKNHILPLIHSEIPEVMLTIVGNPPTPDIATELASPHIRYMGFQDDLSETFKNYQVLIAPVWNGTGIKTKVIEGIARGMPIVATPIGVEGMELTPEEDFLLARTHAEFAQKVVKLLKEPALRQRIANNAFDRFKVSFSFEQVSPKTLASYESVLSNIQAGS